MLQGIQCPGKIKFGDSNVSGQTMFQGRKCVGAKIFSIKDLNLFSKCVKFQDAGGILEVGFAWSNGPHLHRGY